MDRRRNMSLIAAAAKAKRSRLARLYFRAAVRLTYDNHYWLEDTEGEQLGMNVAKNIQILTRKKPKGQFSLTEKAIMKVPQEKRTEAEKHHLRRVLGTMKCFRKYPSEVKKDLAAITYYAEYDADRVIVRQGDEALALYFVISGTARVLNSKYDPLTDQTSQVVVKVKEAGDMFGELALLIGAKRSATIETNERAEFLLVKRDDFDRVLRDTVLKEWNEIKKAINKFEYFKMWDDRYIQQSCMVSKMRYYDENALILSEDHGDKRYVYFLIDGSVDLLECVEMKVTSYKDTRTYSLFNPFEFASLPRGGSLAVDLGKILKDKLEPGKSLSDMRLRGPHSQRFSVGSGENQDIFSKSLLRLRDSELVGSKKKGKRYKRAVFKPSYDHVLGEMTPAQRVNYVKQFESRLSRVTCAKEVPVTTLETYFIRVAKMGELATFNIGEHLDSRYYVSRTKVKLLAIPRYWLLSRDKPTWNNISIFLRNRLPTRQQLYEEFAKKRGWLDYRRECYYDIAGQSHKSNINSINNVPLSIRLKEDLEFYLCSKPFPTRKISSILEMLQKEEQPEKAPTPEEKALKSLRARKRFRTAARLALENQFWLEDFSDMKLGENVLRNIRLLTQKSKKKSNFTIEQKRIMSTEKDLRTEDEKKKLHRVLGGLKCFRRYPNSVKEQLAEVTYFRYIPPKRTVVRQDDEAKALFFLLSGEVVVYRTVFDTVLNEWVTNEVGTREAGTMFGEVSLLHGVKRTATVITSDHCEMLVLRKEDFDAVLRSSVMAEWDEIRRCMSMFTYFNAWDEITLRDCCILSKVKYYGVEDIVLGEDIGDKRYVYFIIEGQCHLVEYLDLEVSEIGCRKSYKLLSTVEQPPATSEKDKIADVSTQTLNERQLSEGSGSEENPERVGSSLDVGRSYQQVTKSIRTLFIRVGIFNPLATFNIGEKFIRRFIITSKRTKVLLIPRYWLIQKNKEIWNHIRHFLNQRLPDTKSVFHDFIQQKKWYAYKRGLVQEILSNCKKVNLNNIHNVPYSIRMQEDMSYYECSEGKNESETPRKL
ncbi:uncharacterized protein LOC123310424 [Coccinella septempunctata]|uniref:uncharacterized protein LOC123310424 n=1 Tax=Coccinella septempunctata TaxID=41139 RepID=UPI001D073610|nr:uncharacterized protein LOC123310424 [Coccinella septempunctata]